MLNNVHLVGRLTESPEIIELEDGKKVTNVTVAVQRPFKNSAGVYEADFIDCTLWNAVASSTCNYCNKGDIVGITGRLETNSYEDSEGKKHYRMKVIAEKVTFLTLNKANENNKNRDDER